MAKKKSKRRISERQAKYIFDMRLARQLNRRFTEKQLMAGDVISRFLGGDMQDLKESKPSPQALEHAKFYLLLFKRFQLLQQGQNDIIKVATINDISKVQTAVSGFPVIRMQPLEAAFCIN